MEGMEAGPLATLADAALSPKKRIHGFLDGMYRLYAKQPNPIGCPLGHAAGDSDGVSAVMKEKALKTLQRITSLFDEAFRDLGDAPGMARVKANLFVNTWQGAIVVARAGEGSGAYRQSLPLSQRDRPSLLLIQECWSKRDSSWSLSYSENGASSDEVCEIWRREPLNVSNAKIPKNVVNRRHRFLTNDVAKASFKSVLECQPRKCG